MIRKKKKRHSKESTRNKVVQLRLHDKPVNGNDVPFTVIPCRSDFSILIVFVFVCFGVLLLHCIFPRHLTVSSSHRGSLLYKLKIQSFYYYPVTPISV